MTVASSPIKCAGGKRKLAATILEILPKTIPRYFESFAGGASVYWAIQEKYPGTPSSLNDANDPLIDVYGAIKFDVENLIKALKTNRYRNNEDNYYRVRETCFQILKEGESKDTRRLRYAAEFIFLNKTGFNGLFRVNNSGKFNVPFARNENPTICDEDNLRACNLALKPAELWSTDFAVHSDRANKKDVVYLDPPYVPANETSDFTKYTAKGFSPDDHIRLRDVALKLKKRGVFVLLSNSDTPFTRSLYSKKDFTLKEVQMARAINSKGTARGKVGELLIY